MRKQRSSNKREGDLEVEVEDAFEDFEDSPEGDESDKEWKIAQLSLKTSLLKN